MILIFLLLFHFLIEIDKISLPIRSNEINTVGQLQLTAIGHFGEWRKERPKVPAHFHTGIDIKRPTENFDNEHIYPILVGHVISKRDDGPYAQLIIEHVMDNKKIWTVYEHISEIVVSLNDTVDPQTQMARFMNKEELDTYGWQFNHFHFEVLKVKPQPLQPHSKSPDRFYNSYTLICYTIDDLEKYFYDPLLFLDDYPHF